MKAAALDHASATPERVTSVREEERRRLARDLHDGPAQTLAAALFEVDLAIHALDRAPTTARDDLLTARALVRDALDDVRALMAGLRPRLLEERGLAVALQSLSAMPPLWGTKVTVETQGIRSDHRLPAEAEIGLFRIAQEAISNARRHGGASRVRVSLSVKPGTAELLIVDDGRGFAQAPGLHVTEKGEGLPGMRERADLLGGELSVDSVPGSGTRISVRVPVPLVVGMQTELKEGES